MYGNSPQPKHRVTSLSTLNDKFQAAATQIHGDQAPYPKY